jgi:exopolysaccharide biosynthesis polyprenyl glycosylphosphotransferase
LLVGGDLLAGCLAYLLAFFLRIAVPLPFTRDLLPLVRFSEVNHHWIELLLAQAIALYVLGLYEARALARPREYLGALAVAPVLQGLILIAVYFFRADLVFPRSVFIVSALLDAGLLVAWRLSCAALMGRYPRRRVLVVGTNAAAAEVIDAVRAQQWLGLDVVGAVAANGAGPRAVSGVPVVGARDDLPELCERHAADEVIIASDPSWQDHLLDDLGRAGGQVRMYVVPSPYEISIGRSEHLRLHDIPLIEVVRDPIGGGARVSKRLFDAGLAGVLLVPAVPVLAVLALLVRLTSRGSVLYRQTRVGREGRPFVMLKLRTMRDGAEEETGPVLAAENDPRVTGLGRFLRAARLDELPQLWNVLRGDMSFVGPRPERPAFVEQYRREISGYAERFKVRPGLTGYAQVNGEYHTSAATKLKYDLAYIYDHSLWLDLKILSATVKVMLTRRGV